MSTYNGACHCGATEWTASLDKDTSSHILCHCNTCKILSGGAYTLNQIIPKDSLKITKGGDSLKNYTYKGDSGNPVHCYYCPNCTVSLLNPRVVLEYLLTKVATTDPRLPPPDRSW